MNKSTEKKKQVQDTRKKSEIMKVANEAAAQMKTIGSGEIKSDVSGSYTGTPHDGGAPEQDADDL